MLFNNKFRCLIAIFIIIFSSCNKRIDVDNNTNSNEYLLAINVGINDSFKNNSKAYYNSINDVAKFNWEKSSDLIVSVTDNNNNLSVWNNSENYYSMAEIIPNENNIKVATIYSKAALKDISNIKTDNNIFCFTPYNIKNNNVEVSSTKQEISIVANIPQTFTQSAFSKLNELSAFTYLYANTKVASVSASEKQIKAVGTNLSTIPAIIQFKITNSLNSNIKVKSVSMRIIDTDNNSIINFPDKLILTAKAEKNVEINEPTDKTNYHNKISAELTTPAEIAQNKSESLFAYILPSSFNLKDKKFEFTVITDNDKKYTVIKNDVDLSINSGKDQFLSGYKYIFNINIEKNESDIDYEGLYLDKNPEKNYFKTRALGIYFTSVGCTYCPPVEERINKLHETSTKDSVVFVTMFESSTFSHFKVKYLYYYLATGTPSVNLDLDKYKKKVGYYSVENLQEEIRENFNRNTLNGQIGIAATVSANSKGDITIDAVVKSAKARDDIKTSAWLIEDSLYDNNRRINHNRVYVDGTITYPINQYNYIASYYGEPVGSITENGYAKKTISIPNNTDNNMSDISKCKVVIYVTAEYDNFGDIRVVNTIKCNIGETKCFEYN